MKWLIDVDGDLILPFDCKQTKEPTVLTDENIDRRAAVGGKLKSPIRTVNDNPC